MIRYYKLFDLLNRRGMKKTDLLEVISAPTLAKLGKGSNIQTDNIDKICLFLHCQPEDIMEVIYKEEFDQTIYDYTGRKEMTIYKPVTYIEEMPDGESYEEIEEIDMYNRPIKED